MTERLCYASAIVFIVAALFANAAAVSQGVSLQETATFSSKLPENHWAVPVKSTDGQTLYILSLEPDFDIWHHVVTVELVLRYPDAKADSSNLLDATGKLHGLQRFHFAAADFAQGVGKSVFGRRRTIVLKELGLIVEMTVLKADVTPTPSGSYQIDKLEVHVTMHHTKGGNGDGH
jgi:hypothetical protein